MTALVAIHSEQGNHLHFYGAVFFVHPKMMLRLVALDLFHLDSLEKMYLYPLKRLQYLLPFSSYNHCRLHANRHL
jgi:hypothetical protein